MKQILAWYTRYFTVWVVSFGILAYLFPAPFLVLQPGMNSFFALTMFGIGAALELEDFKRIVQAPWPVVVGSAAQFMIMPLGAYGVGRLLHLPDALVVGLVLTGAAPGAMASNVMSYIAKADVAYSVSLTTVSTLLCPILTPGLTLLLAGARMDVSFLAMFLSVIKTVVAPLLLGLWVKYKFKGTIERILPVFPAISATFIVFICSMVIAMNRDYLASMTVVVLAACLILNVYGMVGGYGVGMLFRMNQQRRRTLAIEIGMQNAGLGVVLALNHLEKKSAVPAAIFVFVCILTASLLAAWWQRHDAAGDRLPEKASV
ncbi:MAG: bile acid:sodium symporter family protein [Candidatus Hydrogenedentales bacterium]|jgi:BASS family bile acid:Na+ symporter